MCDSNSEWVQLCVEKMPVESELNAELKLLANPVFHPLLYEDYPHMTASNISANRLG